MDNFQNRVCQICGNVGFSDCVDGYIYCIRCNSQADDYVELDVADEDLFNKEGDARGALYLPSHRRRKRAQSIKAEPMSQSDPLYDSQTQLFETLGLDDETPQREGNLQQSLIKEEEDFGGSSGVEVPTFKDYYNKITFQYVMGLQMMIEFQCEALVKEFKVNPLICGLVGPIWLRFVSGTVVFDYNRAKKLIFKSEMNGGETAMAGETHNQNGFDARFQAFDQRLIKLEEAIRRFIQQQQNLNGAEANRDGVQNQVAARNLKWEIPAFDGSDAEFWVFKINQFFTADKVPFDQRVVLASAYMTGPAYVWYKWMCPNQQLPSWDEFLESLLFRFGAIYDIPRVALKKEEQVNTVAEYRTESTSVPVTLAIIEDEQANEIISSVTLEMKSTIQADAAFCGVEEFAEDEVIVSIEASVIDNTVSVEFPELVIEESKLPTLDLVVEKQIFWSTPIAYEDMQNLVLAVTELCEEEKALDKILSRSEEHFEGNAKFVLIWYVVAFCHLKDHEKSLSRPKEENLGIKVIEILSSQRKEEPLNSLVNEEAAQVKECESMKMSAIPGAIPLQLVIHYMELMHMDTRGMLFLLHVSDYLHWILLLSSLQFKKMLTQYKKFPHYALQICITVTIAYVVEDKAIQIRVSWHLKYISCLLYDLENHLSASNIGKYENAMKLQLEDSSDTCEAEQPGERAAMLCYRFLKRTIPLSYTVAVSFLACHVAREAVLPTDIMKWTLEGRLPYFTAFLEIEKRMRKLPSDCPLISMSMFKPSHAVPLQKLLISMSMFKPSHAVPPQKLEALAASIAESIGLELPPVNFYAVAYGYLQKLSLPVEKILPHACRIYEWSMPPDLWLSTSKLRLPTRVCVMTILIVSIRILYNLNGFGEWEKSLSQDDGASVEKENDDGMDTDFPSYDKGRHSEEVPLKPQEPEWDAARLLRHLYETCNEVAEKYEYSKDLSTYLKQCKDCFFAGLKPSFENHEEEYKMELLMNFYEKRKVN
ncbi:TATA box-binding protein-associated factor RNA polymerase I subunit B [Senna tora]|uniref:TATA box-binding protein-associated factor RNA polymerase I subunit B n=1 Tax=Senna tora TaxID=362788 RepID=A0A835CAT1_9FABA|nr:TATA box-binding protein-associated factor RNA polymerase I subunit B [Senna tora]